MKKRHFALNVIILAPVRHFGEARTFHIKADTKEEAYERTIKLLFILNTEKMVLVSKWWYLHPLTVCEVLTLDQALMAEREGWKAYEERKHDIFKQSIIG